MAEGHSIIRWARALQPLIGEPLTETKLPKRWASRARSLTGQHLTRVDTHGKHLLIRLSHGMTIHCHALMYGSWQFGRPRMSLRKAEKNVRLRLRTENHEAVFYNGPVVELLTEDEVATHSRLETLGPDILHGDFDRNEVWRRLAAQRERAIGDAILDQRIVAGIGNIFKSEGLFVAAVDPRTPVALLSRRICETLWDRLITVMEQNARRAGPIVTLDRALRRGGERYWVYRRNKRFCFRCSSPIKMIRQGQLKRTTYFCPNCQKSPTR